MAQKDQKLLQHKEVQGRRKYRNQNPNLEQSRENVRLSDKNVWGDKTPIKVERVISKNKIQEKNDEGLLNRLKMFFRREKQVIDEINQKLTENNNFQRDKKKHKNPSKKKKKLKNKSPELATINVEIQNIMEQKPIKSNQINSKDDKNCLEVKDLYRRKKPEENPTDEHKSNAENVKNANDTRKKTNDCLEAKYPPHNEPNSHKNKQLNELTTESIRNKLEEKIKQELQAELNKFSCRLESIFNEKFQIFLLGYEQQREKRKSEKEERAKTCNSKNGDCENSKEKIINEVLQRLIYNNANFSNNRSAQLKDLFCQPTTTDPKRLLENKSLIGNLAPHVTKTEKRLNLLETSNLPQKKYDQSLSACKEIDVGVHKKLFATDSLKKPQRLLNCETVPLVNIISEIPSQKQSHKQKQNSSSLKPRYKDNEELIIAPPEEFRKPQRQMNCETIAIVNIFPKIANLIQTENYKEKRKSSGKRKNFLLQKPNNELILSPPERFKNRKMNFITIPILNILPEPIQSKDQKSSCATNPRKTHEDNKKLIIVHPVQFKNSQLNSSKISILPETIKTMKINHREANQKSSAFERKNILPPINSIKPPNKLKLDTLSICAIFPNALETIQTQTSYLEKKIEERWENSKRFRSYYRYQLPASHRETTKDFGSIASDSFRNVISFSEEEEELPELEEIYFTSQRFSSSEDSSNSKTIEEEPSKSIAAVAGSSNFKILKANDVCKEDVECKPHKNIPETNSTSKYNKNQDKTNKRTFSNSVNVFEHFEKNLEKSSETPKIKAETVQFNSQNYRPPSRTDEDTTVSTIEACVGSATLNEEDLFGNQLMKKPVETVDAAIGSEMAQMSEEKKYREMSVGTRQLYRGKPPQLHKLRPVSPKGIRKTVVSNVGDVASTNKSKIPIQQLKPSVAISPDKFVRKAEISKIKQTTARQRTAAKIRPATSPKKEACYYPVKPRIIKPFTPNRINARKSDGIVEIVEPETPRAKTPTPESPASVKPQTPTTAKTSSFISTPKSPEPVSPGNNNQVKFDVIEKSKSEIMKKFTNFPKTSSLKSRTAFRSVTRNDPVVASTYEKRKQYDRQLRKTMKNKKTKKFTKNNRKPVKSQKSCKDISSSRLENICYQKPSTNNELGVVLSEAVECVDSCLIQINANGEISSDKKIKLAHLLHKLPVPLASSILHHNNFTCENSVEFLFMPRIYNRGSSSSEETCTDDDNHERLMQNLRPDLASLSCPSLIKKSSTFEYLYEVPTSISSSSSDNRIILGGRAN